MNRKLATAAAGLMLASVLCGAQSPTEQVALGLFAERIDAYVALHRRVEGPIRPLQASNDMSEVKRLMTSVRTGIVAEQRTKRQGEFFTAEVTSVLRKRVAATLARDELLEIVQDLADHSPADMPPPQVNGPLPAGAPFIPIPAPLLAQLPPLPPELRYVILDKSLLLWDHHADLVVDIAPRLFDPNTYGTTGSNPD